MIYSVWTDPKSGMPCPNVISVSLHAATDADGEINHQDLAGSCRDTKITILDNMDLKSLLYDLWDILRQIVNRKTSHRFSVWYRILDRSNWKLPLKNILEVTPISQKSASVLPGLRFP